MTRSIRHPRTALAATALVAVAAVLLSGCTALSGGGGSAGGFARDRVTVHPLYVRGDSGGVGEETISVSKSDDGDTRIDFSEDEVSGFGDMTRAASWNAVTVTTLLTGAPLGTDYRFAFDGAIDGPSAGGLTTVGVLSLYYGDDLKKNVTMTGTINPTGTIGVVGGIPEKVQGAIDTKKIKQILIPAGQRNTQNEKGEMVDVVALGSRGGVRVTEVGTIYEAYRAMTGKSLPAGTDPGDPKLGERAYTKLKSGTDEALARYDRASAQFASLDASITAGSESFTDQASQSATRARDLQRQALQAGAFVEAHQAAAFMEALYGTYSTVQNVLVSGFGALDAQLAAGQTSEQEFLAHLDALGTYRPKTLTDVEALSVSYGISLDAYSLLLDAQGQLEALDAKVQAGSYTSVEQFLVDLFTPLIYYDYARAQLTYSKALFDVGRDNDGGPIAKDADVKAVGSFLRRAANANWAAFESGVIQPAAEQLGVSNDVYRSRLAAVDTNVELSYSAQVTEPQIEAYIGSKNKNAGYAAMGYGIVNYARNAIHLEKYYNNGILDDSLNVVGVTSDTILADSLDLGRLQVNRAVKQLGSHDTRSVIAAADSQVSGVDREGTIAEKFDAITGYSEAFVLSRSMSFLGGYPTDGWKR